MQDLNFSEWMIFGLLAFFVFSVAEYVAKCFIRFFKSFKKEDDQDAV